MKVRQTLSMILENKAFQKLKLSKKINETSAHKLLFRIEKTNSEDS
jgi:hypothetical protein